MHFIVGTAGHIDHGKTALVRALTGQDTDRLKEEKERGISIDLGFAHLDLPGGVRAGVVDVPGHERFIKNMLAGAHGIDLVLFVVAADDGVMPQTEEHLDILHLLGIAGGIVVITKTDLVPEERLREVREEIEILTLDTVLEGAPVVPVSSATGRGLDELRLEIVRRLEQGRPRRSGGRFRLPVDRAFVIHGHGVIVTGTAVGGTVAAGTAVRLLPGGEEARVRSVQVHGRDVARGERGQRVALNLAGIERTQVTRGHVVTEAAVEATTRRFDALVEIRPLAKRPIASRRRVRVHIGTAEVLARLVLLGGKKEIAPRETAPAQIVCEEPVVAFRGDRFILRNESAQRTLGGGEVVHPFAPRHRARDIHVPEALERIRSSDLGAACAAILGMDREFARPPAWLAQALDVGEAEVLAAVARPDLERLPSSRAVQAIATRERWERWVAALLETVGAFHRASPLLPGMEMELLRGQLPDEVPSKLFRDLVDRLAAERRITREESLVRLPAHRVRLQKDEVTATARIETMIEDGGFTPPDVKQIAEAVKLPPKRTLDLLQALERDHRAAKVTGELYYHAAVLDRLKAMVTERCARSGQLTAAEFRDMIGASRKYAIPLLEYFDRTGFTMRIGDARKLRHG
ncbi:MAG: selenocysteine-specific elongation factor [Candidatus Binatota bacterium]|nr:selenocysteine-specific elongation factor [Candidatus Binatota bacterium]